MGGRATFASGNPVDYSYKTVGKISGVKVLEGLNGNHGLPESSHSSDAYIKLDKDGNFRAMRFYDSNHCCYLEIAYHQEKNLSDKNKVLHYHTYDNDFSKTKGGFKRSKAKELTDEMLKKYKKYLKGIKL